MRKIKLLYAEPKFGDTKVIKKFAFLPITICTKTIKETRWLEQVKIEYEYKFDSSKKIFGYSIGWHKKRFLDE